tara:strand:- start:409 stop:1284 length:876 start_codon:yes stop_codon:yes gene_type:complete
MNNTTITTNKTNKELNKYYTKDYIVNNCINSLLKVITINKKDLVIEPSAGNGSFIKYIKKLTNNYKFYDIVPEHKEIIKQDYLLLDEKQLIKLNKKIHVIGNPPFGKYNKLARAFVKKSCKFANTISFILPSSFKKESLKKTFNTNFHLENELELPFKSFVINDKEHGVNCVFQTWVRKDIERLPIKKIKPYKFRFVLKSEEYRDISDIAIFRARSKAGKVITNFKEEIDAPKEYCNFIKFGNNINKEKLIPLLQSLYINKEWEHNNTGTTQKSISQQEIIKKFNPIIKSL